MSNISLHDWIRFHGTFEADPEKKVVGVEFQVEAKDTVSSTSGVDRQPFYFTDIQFQAGGHLTGWIPNTKEMLERLTWTIDESVNVAYPNRFEGSSPKVFENVEKRSFNLLGRGHDTVVVPNYLPEDWGIEILPTGLDISLYPKEDYDLLRISSSVGVEIPKDEQWYKREGGIYREIKEKYDEVTSEHYYGSESRKKQEISNWHNVILPLLENHPLHKRYTREFWVEGGKAGNEIKVSATTRTAKLNGKEIKVVGEHEILINGSKFYIDRKKFMLAPKGTATFRIEFYKQVEQEIVTYNQDANGDEVRVKKTFRFLKDVGIGYYGMADFYQWTYGKSKL